MKKQTTNEYRRDFLKTLVPVGTMLCMGCPSALAVDVNDYGEQDQDIELKIKNEFSISCEKYVYAGFDHFIGTMNNLANYMGRDMLIKMLKRSTDDKNLLRKPNEEATSVRDFINPFLESAFFKNSQDLEVLKLTGHVCEIKVTNCLWAKAFRRPTLAMEIFQL